MRSLSEAYFPVPGQQFIEAGLGYVGDPREHVGEPDERIDIVEPACGDEGISLDICGNSRLRQS